MNSKKEELLVKASYSILITSLLKGIISTKEIRPDYPGGSSKQKIIGLKEEDFTPKKKKKSKMKKKSRKLFPLK